MKPIWIELYEEDILKLSNDADLGEHVRRKYWQLLEQKDYDKIVEYDHCVICGKQSPYTRETHIDNRIGYIDGGGQGCFTPNKCDKI